MTAEVKEMITLFIKLVAGCTNCPGCKQNAEQLLENIEVMFDE